MTIRTAAPIGVGATLALGGLLAAQPAQAQITAVFTNTNPIITPLGLTNVIDVERASSAGVPDLTTLNVSINVAAGYEFQGFTVLTLPSDQSGNALTSSDVTQSAMFSSAVTAVSSNPTAYQNTAFNYTGSVLDLQVRNTLPTGLYYRYALDGAVGFARTFIRFQARPIGDTNSNNIRTTTLFYGVNVLESGSLGAVNAPEPGTLALGIGTLPLIGGILLKRRRR